MSVTSRGKMPPICLLAALLPAWPVLGQTPDPAAEVPPSRLAPLPSVVSPTPPVAALPRIAAPTPVVVLPQHAAPTRMSIEAGQGRVMSVTTPIATLFSADPRVAEVRPASPTTMFLFGVGPGRTTIAAMDEAGRAVAQWEVTVRPQTQLVGEAQAQLQRLFPMGRMRVDAGVTGVVLTGEVTSAADAERAVAMLRTRLEERVTIDNRLTVSAPQQVNLRVRVAEISREVTRELGVNWQALGSIGRFGIAALTRNSLPNPTAPADVVALAYRGAVDLNLVIDALAQDRLITILAEPNLIATTGETASFLAGGEFPIPVSQRDNQVTIEFKQFGVSLAFVPTVVSDGRISLRVKPEVSELSEQGAVRLLSGNDNTITVPSLSVRRAETTVELGSGQSFAIAGLLQDTTRQTGRALPQIGEIPILGALFRSDRFRRNETELVIIITPYLVRPVSNPTVLGVPTDGFRPANEIERVLLLRQVSRSAPMSRRLGGDPGFIVE